MNLAQARLSVSERLLYLASALILLVVFGIIALFLLLRSQANQQTTDLSNQVDKILAHQECLAKIYITPIGEPKAIVGDVNDPATALENCRIQADGLVSNSDTQPAVSPPDEGQPTQPIQSQQSKPTPQSQARRQNNQRNTPSTQPNPPLTVSLPGPLPTVSACLPFSNVCARAD